MIEKRTEIVQCRVKPSVKRVVQAAAEAKGMTVSEWLMDLIKKAVKVK